MADVSWLKSFGGGFLKLFGSVFKIHFFWFFTLFIILNAFIIGYQTNNYSYVISDLGERSLTPTLKLHQTSVEIISNQGLFSIDRNAFEEMFYLWGVLSEFWFIYFEIVVFAWIYRKVILWDDSKGGVSILLGTATFFVLQMLILSLKGQDMFLPFNMFKEISSAGSVVINEFVNIGDLIKGSSNQSSEILNNTLENVSNLTEKINQSVKGVITYN